MLSRSIPARPVDWPSPYSRAGRVLGWLNFSAALLGSAFCQVAGLACYVAGGVAFVCLVVLAVPVAAVLALGWLSRAGARRLLPPLSC